MGRLLDARRGGDDGHQHRRLAFATAANRPANSSNQTLCSSVHPIGVALGGTGQWGYKDDYIPHHEPFQYYASTANPHHVTIATDGAGNDTLAGLAQIGTDTQSYAGGQPQFNTPNHQYDTSDFSQLVGAISAGQLPASALPAVSYLKAPGYQDGHPGYSEPANEQQFIASTINALMKSPDWRSTAVIVNYDDSDSWYDHVYSGVINPSLSPADNLTATTTTGATSGQCGPKPQTSPPLAGEQGRCGFGPRLPMLVISPYVKHNRIDHNLSDQASIVNFIEYNGRLPSIPGSADQVLAGTNHRNGFPSTSPGCSRSTAGSTRSSFSIPPPASRSTATAEAWTVGEPSRAPRPLPRAEARYLVAMLSDRHLILRQAEHGDVDTVYELIVALSEYERLRDRVTGTRELLETALFGPRPAAEAMIAELDSDPVGFALYFHTFSTFVCRPGLWLEDLFVVPEHRRAGIGTMLLSHLAKVAVERGCARFEWSALNWNEPALKFYDALGAELLTDWRTLRMEGESLRKLAGS